LDNVNSLQNVKRFVSSLGHEVKVTENEGLFELIIQPVAETTIHEKVSDSYIILITSDTFGEGERQLGTILMKSFLNTNWHKNALPRKILLLDVLDTLKLLSDSGVEIVSCGTCLAFYEITDNLKIGHAGNMYEVVESLLDTTKVIKI